MQPFGAIQAPGHPHNYPNLAMCTWTFEVAIGFRIEFVFGSQHFIEEESSCSFDKIEVRFSNTAT